MKELYAQMEALLSAGTDFSLVTVVAKKGSGPREPGAKMVVTAEGRIFGTIGGGSLENRAMDLARESLKSGETLLKHFHLEKDVDSICGGEMTLFIEPHRCGGRLLLFGAGHVGRALHDVIAPCGFRLTVVDDRAEMVTAERFPRASERLHFPRMDQALAEGTLTVYPGDYLLIMTRSHDLDRAVLYQLLQEDRQAAYLGIIGSRAKLTRTFQSVLEAGVPAERLDAVHAPVGLDTGGGTPEEIAISVAAELLAVKYGKTAGFLRDRIVIPRRRDA